MKTYQFPIILALFALLLLVGCEARPAPVMAVPVGAQAGELTGLKDCEFRPESSRTKHADVCSALITLLDQQVKKQGIFGMVLAVRLADGTVILGTSGYTSPSGNERWSANTVSLLASVTKTFSAVVVMQLVEEGKLSLDDTVDTWFPEQPNGDKITVRMLLSHTSGLGEYQASFGMDPEKWTREWTPEELIAIANQAGAVGKPGSRWAHYSNTNYIMLGRIIEKVTANSWANEVESRIIHPLGLEDTIVGKTDLGSIDVIPGYMKTSDGYQNLLEIPWYSHMSASTAWAAGGIASSVSDLMTFASALFDGMLVSKETLDLMTKRVGAGNGWVWGLGVGKVNVSGHKAFAMGGDSTGYRAFFIGTLEGKCIVTALANTDADVISPSKSALQMIRR